MWMWGSDDSDLLYGHFLALPCGQNNVGGSEARTSLLKHVEFVRERERKKKQARKWIFCTKSKENWGRKWIEILIESLQDLKCLFNHSHTYPTFTKLPLDGFSAFSPYLGPGLKMELLWFHFTNDNAKE